MKKNKNITAMVPVVEDNDHHPLRAKKIKKRRELILKKKKEILSKLEIVY